MHTTVLNNRDVLIFSTYRFIQHEAAPQRLSDDYAVAHREYYDCCASPLWETLNFHPDKPTEHRVRRPSVTTVSKSRSAGRGGRIQLDMPSWNPVVARPIR